MSGSKFQGNLLVWPITRSARTFRTFVVEPREYRPQDHVHIFNAALTALIALDVAPLDPYVDNAAEVSFESFDLLTFPEAFLPKDQLIATLELIREVDSFGCVHVGLRPTESNDRHLFKVQEIRDLISSLRNIPQINEDDFRNVSAWLAKQSEEKVFNIGCLFTIDTSGSLRICLHPKVVRSKVEVSPFEENHMEEADLLTMITLIPADNTFFSVTLQPLICSDVLCLDTDRSQGSPLEGVNAGAECFQSTPPDHVDIVSVMTCTPQQEQAAQNGKQYRSWHQEFLSSFVRAAKELPRHHYAAFVLSNFLTVPSAVPGFLPGGLSGAFIPLPFANTTYPVFVTHSSWGHARGQSINKWSTPDDDVSAASGWMGRGHIVALDPFSSENAAAARMMGFTIQRLPRDTSRWASLQGLAKFQLRSTMTDPTSGRMIFGKQEF